MENTIDPIRLKQDYEELIEILHNNNYNWERIPSDLTALNPDGESYSISYPIQGLLKYHGMVNESQKIAYFPSISLNNQSGFTITFIKLDKTFHEDQFIINGQKLIKNDPKFKRIAHQLTIIRDFTKIATKAIII